MTKRRCNGTTKKDTPCGANPLKPGTVIEGVTVTGDWCRQHDLDLPDSARIGGATPGAGRKPNPRAVDVLRDRIEENIDRVIQPLWDALEAEAGIALNIKGGGMELAMIPDHLTRLRAVRELLDRGYGRPKQSSEVTVITQDAIDKAIERLEADLASNDGDSGESRVDRTLQATEGASR